MEIRKNFVYTKQSSGSAGNGTADGGGSATAVFKNATFEFVGGNSQKFRLEVGTPLEARNLKIYPYDLETGEIGGGLGRGL